MITVESADVAFIAADPAIPGLRDVLDPTALLERSGWDVAEAEVRYVRYKPATSIVAGIALTDRAGRTSMAQAFAFGDGGRDKVQKYLWAGEADQVGRGVVLIDGGTAGLADATSDRHLPGIARLLTDHPSVQPLVYKPGKRWVGRHGEQVLTKIFARDAIADLSSRYRALDGLPVPRVLDVNARRGRVDFEWIPGTTVDRLASFQVPHYTRLAGALLAQVHGRPVIPGLPTVDLGSELQAALQALEGIAPRHNPRARRVADAVLEGLPAVAPSVVHGDFSADQVVVRDGARNGSGQLALLDLDRVGLDDPHADLGSWFGCGVAAGSIQDLDDIEPLLEGYRAAGGHLDPGRLRLHCASGILHRAVEPFRYRQPEWDREIERLIDVAEELVGEDQRG